MSDRNYNILAPEKDEDIVMASRRGFTLIELMFIIVIIMLLVLLFVPSLISMRSQVHHVSCMNNLRQLAMSWINYAYDHSGQIVNGEGGIWRTRNGVQEVPWTGRCWSGDYRSGGQMPEEEQVRQIKKGDLWPYVPSINLYKCPTGMEGERLTYACMDSMYGRTNGRGVDFSIPSVYISSFWELPIASTRAVFLCEGWVTPDSYAVYYNQQKWWDDAAVRHGRGTTYSFADGHAERWKWSDETVVIGTERIRGHPSLKFQPITPGGRKDLYRQQLTTYGRLGYNPSDPVMHVEAMWDIGLK
jgi:prepilin-type processing-associated H-X9-DG protein